MIDIGTQKPQGKTFAINLVLRNPKTGVVTGVKYFETDSASELSDIWTRYNGLPTKKEKKEQDKQQEVNK